MRLFALVAVCLSALWLSGCGTPYATVENSAEEPVMLLGHDPTAYFTRGEPVRGLPEHRVTMGMRTYYFASAESRALFLRTPWQFEPQYGGFCSSGAAYGIKLGSDPTAWQIHRGRLYIFGDVLGKMAWQLDPDWHVAHADRLWPEIRAAGWRGQSLMRYVDKVPHYRTGAEIVAEWRQRNPGKEWPSYDTGSMWTNLMVKPPGWRAAEGYSQPALGYPQ